MKIKYDLEYDHLAYVEYKGQRINIGHAIFYADDNKGTCSVTVEFYPETPDEIQKAVAQDPKVLKFIKVTREFKGVIVLP